MAPFSLPQFKEIWCTFLFFVIFSNSKLHFVRYNWDLRNFRPFSKFACKFIAWVEESSEYVGRDSYGCQYSLQWNIRPLLIFHVLSEVCNEIWFDLINILLSLIVDLVFEPDPDYEQNIISWWHRLAGAAQFVMATCVVTDIQMESLQGMDGPREGPLLPAIVFVNFHKSWAIFQWYCKIPVQRLCRNDHCFVL